MRSLCCLCIAFFVLLCVSPAGAQTSWIKYPGNPVFDPAPEGAWDDTRVGPDGVIMMLDTFMMWYTGWDGTSGRNFRIGLARSTDGTSWTREPGNPVLDVGAPGTWESWSVSNPSVLRDGGIYEMWYAGNDGSHGRIGYATSSDGMIWEKHADNPVLDCGPPGSWDSWAAHWCSVIKDGAEYKMWYSGGSDFFSHRIGYATSPDGVNWTKYAGNYILGPEDIGHPPEDQVWFPHVVKAGARYHMWFNAHSTNCIYYASSLDGIAWDVYEHNPVLSPGAPGEWDDDGLNSVCVLAAPDKWKMWYQGFEDISLGIGRVGYAVEAPDVCLFLDIKPGSCPNPLNTKIFEDPPENANPKKGGVLPAAILGTEEFGVDDIDVSSLLLHGVAPLRHGYEDVSTPREDPEECGCPPAGQDGFVDLTLKFQKSEIAAALGPAQNGDVIRLTLTGRLNDGTLFEAHDCITILTQHPDPAVAKDGNTADLEAAVPNPFNPMTTIRFGLREPAHVTLRIYDAAGHLVRTLVDGHHPVGRFEATWDGCDDAGRQAASGVYFYRLNAGGFEKTRKMVLLK